MKALTVYQPYAEMIARLDKPIENRSWSSRYRGPLLIHAGKSRDWLEADDEREYPGMAFGAFVAVADLVATPDLDRALDWPVQWRHLRDHVHANGPFCWILDQVWRLPEPIPCSGKQGLWTPDPVIVQAVTHGVMTKERA